MKNQILIIGLALLAGMAQATVLTFDTGGGMPQAYGDYVTNTTMGAYSYGEAGEGFTPNVAVEYIGDGGDGLDFWSTGYGDLVNIVENEDNGERWTILRFAATLGCEVILHDMDLGNYNLGSLLIDRISITNESGTVLFQQDNFTLAGRSSGHTNMNFGSVTGQVLTLVLDLQTAAVTIDNDKVGLDNITFSQTGTAIVPNTVAHDGAVPSDLFPGGTEADPALYIIGLTNAYVRDFGSTPLNVGYDSEKVEGYSYVHLYIQNGSTVTSGDDSNIGVFWNEAHRLVRLTDASTWTVGGRLYCPNSGNDNKLEVLSGSLVHCTTLNAGGGATGDGEIVVSNANSRIIITGDITGGAINAYSELTIVDHALVRVDGTSINIDNINYNGGFLAWAGDHTSNIPGNPRGWNGTGWQDAFAPGEEPFVYSATYCATDAEAKLLTSDLDAGFTGYDNLGGYTLYTASIPILTVTNTLTVVSEHGSPVPTLGTNAVVDGSAIACSVDAVTNGSTNYSPIGWTLSGQEPASGTTNWFELTSTTNATLTWNWQTNYWLNINVTGNGSVDVSDGFYTAGSEQILTATPDAGWLFMGWSGDASGTNDAVVMMAEPQTVMATFSDDADGDGLTNTEEAGLGSNPWKTDTDGDGFGDKLELENGGSPTVSDQWRIDYISANGGDFDLYASNVVLDVALGEMLLDIVDNEASLKLQLEESDDLVIWTNAGSAKVWSWTVGEEKKFFRVRSGN